MRVKYIVIITYNSVRKQTHIQTQFKRAYLMLFSVFCNLFPAKIVHMSQHIIHRIVNSVIVPFGVRAVIRVTFCLFHKAYFVFSSQYYSFKLQPFFPQNLKGIVRNSPCNRLRCEIKNPLPFPLPYRLHRRKNGRYGLAHSCGRFYKQFLPVVNRLVYIGYQIFLPFSVGKGELHPFN